MNSQKDKESSNVRSAVITGIFVVIAACISVTGVVITAFINNGFIFAGAGNQNPYPTTAPVPTQLSSPTDSLFVQQPTQQLISPTKTSRTIPQSASDAANLFGGPPTNDWQACPQENNCWMFSLPNNSFKIKVPEYCLNANGSIDGWRYHGGYPEQPDTVEGTIRIWNSLEAVTIRCR